MSHKKPVDLTISKARATRGKAKSEMISGSPESGEDRASALKVSCQVCGDESSGKHYGAYSCEGCKGFFKRTVRKELQYSCRAKKDCIIDKRKRNRCQYCRYHKCLRVGMKRESVQKERRRQQSKMKEGENPMSGNDSDDDNSKHAPSPPCGNELAHAMDSSSSSTDYCWFSKEQQNRMIFMTDHILQDFTNPMIIPYPMLGDISINVGVRECAHILSFLTWARSIPNFSQLVQCDQAALIAFTFAELTLLSLSFRSVTLAEDMLSLPNQSEMTREQACNINIELVFDQVLFIVNKLRMLAVDRREFCYLCAAILLNPDLRGLKSASLIENLRDQVFALLNHNCINNHQDDPSRFSKLLLLTPMLRGVSLHFSRQAPAFLFKMIPNESILGFIQFHDKQITGN